MPQNVTVLVLLITYAVDCGTPPNIDNGSPDVSSTLFGAVATYMCDEGYQLATPANQTTCLSSGNWSNEIILCEAGIVLLLPGMQW